jgi:hypothetical protein
MEQICKKVEIIWDGQTTFIDIVEGIYETLTLLNCKTNKLKLGNINSKIWNDDITYIFIPMVKYVDSLLGCYPKHFIFYQIEQHNSGWLTDKYLFLVNKADQLWNFHDRYDKISDIFKQHTNSFYVPFAYHSHLEKSNVDRNNIAKDIDVLFLGGINERRMNIINSLKNKGLKVLYGSGCSRDEHIELIYRSKVYLNIHYYGEDSVMESARISLAISQSAFIISEPSILEDENKLFNKFLIISSSTEDLINKCYEYANNDALRSEFINKALPLYKTNFPLKRYMEPCINSFHNSSIKRILYITAKFGDENPKDIVKSVGNEIVKYICYTDAEYDNINNNPNIINCEYCRFNEEEKREICNVIYNKGMTRPNVIKARFVKTQFYKLQKVKEFNPDIVIWIDASMQIIKDDFHYLIEDLLNDSIICTYPHNFLTNYIEDLDYVLNLKTIGIVKRYGDEPIKQQKDFYISEGFTEEVTNKKEYLCTGIVGFRLNEENITLLNLWWQDILKWSIHDQVSLFYILFKHIIKHSYIRSGTIVGSDYHRFWGHP